MWRFTQPRSRPVGCETSHQQIWVDCGLDENWSVGWVVGWVRGGERDVEVYTTQSPSPTFTTSPPFPVQLSPSHKPAPTICAWSRDISV